MQVLDYTFAEAQPAKTDRDQISDRQLHALLAHKLGENDYQALVTSWRVVAKKHGYELVKVRNFQQKLGKQATAQINVYTGEIFEVNPTRYFVTSQGEILASLYPRNYLDDADLLPLNNIKVSFVDQQAPVFIDVTGFFNFFDNNDNNTPPVLAGLHGKYVEIRRTKKNTALIVEAEKIDDTWLIEIDRNEGRNHPHDAERAQSMLYYHIDKIFRVASEHVDTSWFDKPLITHADNKKRTKRCNAYYSGFTRAFYRCIRCTAGHR